MSKVAVVTGGTRGIGRAISVELKNKGYQVVANYGGNDEAAQKFQTETGIPILKWDVGDYDACVAGLKQVEEKYAPISVIVNNAGVTREAMLHRMKPQQWKDVIRIEPDSAFNMTQPVINGCATATRADHQHLILERPERPDGAEQLLLSQGRDYRFHESGGSGKR